MYFCFFLFVVRIPWNFSLYLLRLIREDTNLMKNIQRYIFILLLLLTNLSVYADSYAFRGLSVSDGLSDLLVNVIYKDADGYVWLGTGSSLERFDGVHIKHYQISGTNEKLKRINAITGMSDGQIWMGNGMGLWRLSKGQDTLVRIVPEKIDCQVYSLLSEDETLYIGSEKGLFIHKGGKLEQVLLDKNTFSVANTITGICKGEDNLLWLVTGNGLYSLHLPDGKISTYHNIKEDKHICAFNHIAKIGTMLYLGTMEQGIISFDTRTSQFNPYVDVGCNVISSLSTDGKNTLYVGTDGNGVHFIAVDQKKVVRSFRHETGSDDGLRSNSVYSLLVDREGIMWVGFYQYGLDYTLYQNELFTTYAFPPFFDSKDVPIRAISIRKNEKLIGSRDGLFYIDEQKHRFKSFKAPQMRSSMVFCTRYYQDEYYIGTYGGGMYVLNPVTLTLRDFAPDLPIPFQKGHIFSITEDANGQLWIGTSAGVYCYKDGKQIAFYNSANSKLPEGNVYEIHFDSTGKGWVCTENGMCIWDPSSSKLRTDIFPEGFIHKEKIRVIYEDSRHTLYFFPDKGSLFVSDLSLSSFHYLHPGTPLEGRDGLFIIEDKENWLWMGTSNGLFRYDKKDNFVPYNFVDGIPSSTFTLCPPVYDGAGGFWFGNTKGLLYLDATRMNRENKSFYPMMITDVYVNGKPSVNPITRQSDGGSEISLEASQKNITFCFSDFSYTSPNYMSYEYQLEGEDANWIAMTGNSDVTYYNLSSGTYTFKVRLMGKPETETKLTVRIASDFVVWIGLGIIIVLLLSSVIFYFMRNRKNSRKTEKQQVKEIPLEVPEIEKHVAPVLEEKYKTIKVSPEECKHLVEQLEFFMKEKKSYTNPDLKIADLATMLNTTAHTLSYLFNQYLNRNYYDYVNDYRISEFKRLVEKDEYAKYTLSALAELCGFSSRASFFRYFKKATGITPNEYVRSIGKNNE